MKRIILILTVLIITNYTFAQTPEWLWAESAGGDESDYCFAISTDTGGNIYIIGYFWETASFGSFNLISNGERDIFIAKIDSDGSWLWVNNAGGISDDDKGYGISTDNAGNVYVAGYFSGTASFGSFNLTSNGEKDIFIAKIDSNGNWLWVDNVGGNSHDLGRAINTDAYGNIYLTGYFCGTVNFGSFNLVSNGIEDIFVAKMNSYGNWLWAESAGGSSYDKGYAISTDTVGNVYVTGYFADAVSFGTFNLNSSGENDIFVAVLNSNGNWIRAESVEGNFHSPIGEIILSSDTDTNGNVYITGTFFDTVTFGSLNLTNNGEFDFFVAKMDSDGNWLWAENVIGDDHNFGRGINIDVDGNVYITGSFRGTTIFGSFNLISNGIEDIFVAKINSNGNWLWAESAGGSSYDKGYAISTDAERNVYITGSFNGSISHDPFNLTSFGESDIFVAKIGNTTSVENEIIPTINALYNYPNPFNPLTTIQFNIRENEKCVLSIYNIKGQLIESQQIESGQQNYIWDASNQNSGIYLYKLETENVTQTRKMLLLK